MTLHRLSTPPRLRSAIVGLSVCSLLWGSIAAPCQAGLFSWLRRRRAERTVVLQPVIANCAPTRTVVNYAPQTIYSTSWVRVPVTTYRAVQTTDPATCCQVSYMQPTTSYVWQARRQPHVIYKPFLSRVAQCCPCCNGSCPTGTAAPPTTTVPAAGGPAMAPLVTTPGPAPAGPTYPPSPYEQPGAGQPNTFVAPSTGMPLPGAAAPPTGVGVPGAGPTPADTRPRLQPNFAPPTTQQRPIIQWPSSPAVGSGLANPAPTTVPRTYSPPATTAPQTYRMPATTAPQTYSPPPTTAPRTYSAPTIVPRTAPAPTTAPRNYSPPASANYPPASNGSSSTTAPNGSLNGSTTRARPVPDPEYPQSSTPAPSISLPSVPRLLNPTDRSASLSPRLMVPVSWPSHGGRSLQPISAGAGGVEQTLQPLPSRAPMTRPRRLDDTGWKSL